MKLITVIYCFSTDATVQVSFGSGVGTIHLTNVECQGNETSLVDCLATTSGQELIQCTHINDASLRCQAQTSQYNNIYLDIEHYYNI